MPLTPSSPYVQGNWGDMIQEMEKLAAQTRAERGSNSSNDDIASLQERIERLKSHLRIAVIHGGDKSVPGNVIYTAVNSRSWKSYQAVAQDIANALKRIGFQHVELMPDDMHLGERLRRSNIHLAWLNSGGVQGYNSAAHAAAMLEMLGVPYIGHDSLAATTLDNKHTFKRETTCAGIPTAAFMIWNMARGAFRPDLNSRFKRAFGSYQGPFVVKPVSGRASLHVHVVDDVASLPGVVAEIYEATHNLVLIERFLPGREFCIAVAGAITARGGKLSRQAKPFSFAALERVLTDDEKIFTSMDVRPITADRFRPLDPIEDADLLRRMHELACEVFLEFNLNSIIRLDIRGDENGQLHILEANPKPDLKQPTQGVTSLISAGLPELGMDYDDLILSLFADKLDFLFKHRAPSMEHIVALLDAQAAGVPIAAPAAQAIKPMTIGEAVNLINELRDDLNEVARTKVNDDAPPRAAAESDRDAAPRVKVA